MPFFFFFSNKKEDFAVKLALLDSTGWRKSNLLQYQPLYIGLLIKWIVLHCVGHNIESEAHLI